MPFGTQDELREHLKAILAERDDLRDTLNQCNVNFDFLLAQIDAIHGYLCDDQWGTWQERAVKAVAAAKQIRHRARR